MKVYLDLCCLKRPFDDTAQPRVRIEADAVLAILGASPERFDFVRAPTAQDLENDFNPMPARAGRVREWLEMRPPQVLPSEDLAKRTGQLVDRGFKPFDALHLASAELAGSDVLLTCDDRFLRTAQREARGLKVRVLDPVEFVREIFP